MADQTATITESPAPQSSVQIETMAKGAPKVSVKAYATSIDDAATEAMRVYDLVVARYAPPAVEPGQIADEAIGLFLEFRDQHGESDEEVARAKAVLEISEGCAVDTDQIDREMAEERPCGPTTPGTDEAHHMAYVRQVSDGWQAACPCGWRYENTSPSLVRSAADQHDPLPF